MRNRNLPLRGLLLTVTLVLAAVLASPVQAKFPPDTLTTGPSDRDVAEVAWDEDVDADHVAASVHGDARCTRYPCVAGSVGGDAEAMEVAVSVTGAATSERIAASVFGPASVVPCAHVVCVAASVFDDVYCHGPWPCPAVSGTGHAACQATCAAVSLFGTASCRAVCVAAADQQADADCDHSVCAALARGPATCGGTLGCAAASVLDDASCRGEQSCVAVSLAGQARCDVTYLCVAMGGADLPVGIPGGERRTGGAPAAPEPSR